MHALPPKEIINRALLSNKKTDFVCLFYDAIYTLFWCCCIMFLRFPQVKNAFSLSCLPKHFCAAYGQHALRVSPNPGCISLQHHKPATVPQTKFFGLIHGQIPVYRACCWNSSGRLICRFEVFLFVSTIRSRMMMSIKHGSRP